MLKQAKGELLGKLSPFFSLPPSNLELRTDEIHIWWAGLDQPVSQFSKLIRTLSIDDRIRADRFHFEQDRRYFMVSRGILRTILGLYAGVEPSRVQFCYGKNGKPALADALSKEDICFSLSHSEGFALYGFSRGREIGVDVEYMRDISEMDQITERLFSARENEVFRALPQPQKKEAFFKCWTRKEAYIKAIGQGLSHPLNRFDVTLAPGEPAELLRIEGHSKAISPWSIQDLEPVSGVAAALVAEGRGWRVHCWQWLE